MNAKLNTLGAVGIALAAILAVTLLCCFAGLNANAGAGVIGGIAIAMCTGGLPNTYGGLASELKPALTAFLPELAAVLVAHGSHPTPAKTESVTLTETKSEPVKS